nr:MAG TPA: tail tape measure protein [Caudoviricetes sp.]
MVEAATEFRKNGFNDSDAATLAKTATVFQNVSDEAISAGDSASFIISQMIAFGIEAKDAQSIIDKVNQTSNEFSVSSGDLAKALGIVASTSSAMGNSLDETLGMVVAMTEQTRSASKSARGLNTISSRLSQVLDDTSDTGKKLVAIYDDLGISLYDSSGQMRSTYDILSDLHDVWGTLDTDTQKYIALTSSGTNQLNNFLALMNNFDHATEATKTSLNSAGSAMRENEAYQQSLEYQTQELKAEFQDLANNVIDKQLISGFLNFGETLLKVGNTDIGQFMTKVGLLAGTSWGIESLLHVSKILPTMGKQFTNLGTAIKLAASGAGTFVEAIVAVGGAASVALPIILAVSAAIVACVEANKAFEAAQEAKKFENLVKNYENLKDEAEGASDKLEELKQKLEELNAVPADERDQQWRDEQAEVKTLIEYYNQLERARKAQADEAGAAAYGADRESGVTVGQYYQGKYGAESREVGRYATTTEAVTSLAEEKGVTLTSEQIDALSEITDEGERAAKAIDYLKQNLEVLHYTFDSTKVSASEYQSTQGQLMLDLAETASKSDEVSDAVLQQRDAYMEANEAEYLYLSGLETLNEAQQKFVDGYEAIAGISGTQTQNIQELGTAAEESASKLDTYIAALDQYRGANENAADASGVLVNSLFDANGQLTEAAKQALSTSGSMASMAQSFIQAQQAQAQADFSALILAIQEVGNAAMITTSQLASMMAMAGVGTASDLVGGRAAGTTSDMEGLRQAYFRTFGKSADADTAGFNKWVTSQIQSAGQSNYQKKMEEYKKQLESIKSYVPSGGGGGGSSSTKKDQEEVKTQTINTIEELREYLTDESTRLKLIDPDISKSDLQSTLSEVATIYQSYQDYLSQLKQQGFDETSEQYKEAEAEFAQFVETIKNLLMSLLSDGKYSIDEIMDYVEKNCGNLSDMISGMLDTVKDNVSSAVSVISGSLNQAFASGDANSIIGAIEHTRDMISAMGDSINEQYDAAREAAISNASAEGKVAQEVADEYDRQNQLLEDKIALEEKLEALEKAKQRRMLVYSEGRFQYMQDADAISSAQTEYQETYRDVEQRQIKELMGMIGDESSKFFKEYFEEGGNVRGYKDVLQSHLMEYAREQLGGSVLEGISDDQLYSIFGEAMKPGEAYNQLVAAEKAKEARLEEARARKEELKKQIREENVKYYGVDTDFGEKIKNAQSQAEVAYWTKLRDTKQQMIKEYREAYGDEAASKYFGTDVSKQNTWSSNRDLYKEAYESGSKAWWFDKEVLHRQNYVNPEDEWTEKNPELTQAQYNASTAVDMEGFGNQRLYNRIFSGAITKDEIQDLYNKSKSDISKGYLLNLASEMHKAGYQGYARGTRSANSGLSVVGENGPELRVLNQGDGILPNSITDNLWRWGSMTPRDMLSSLAQKVQNWAQTLNISNVTLPNVRDAQSFVSGLRELAQQYVTRRS